MITEEVWTPIKHEGKDLKNSPIWAKCYKPEEVDAEIRKTWNEWYVYTIKFDGLIPIQITKVRKLKS